MQFFHSGDAPVYAPNSYERAFQDEQGPVDNGWEADGELVRAAYSLHEEDDDWGQAHDLVRNVMDEAARTRLVDTVSGMLLDGVDDHVARQAIDYWKHIDTETGEKIEAKYTQNK